MRYICMNDDDDIIIIMNYLINTLNRYIIIYTYIQLLFYYYCNCPSTLSLNYLLCMNLFFNNTYIQLYYDCNIIIIIDLYTY